MLFGEYSRLLALRKKELFSMPTLGEIAPCCSAGTKHRAVWVLIQGDASHSSCIQSCGIGNCVLAPLFIIRVCGR